MYVLDIWSSEKIPEKLDNTLHFVTQTLSDVENMDMDLTNSFAIN